MGFSGGISCRQMDKICMQSVAIVLSGYFVMIYINQTIGLLLQDENKIAPIGSSSTEAISVER
jgi:hypothetical protein